VRIYTAVPFWDRVDRSGDCWLWTGAHDQRGYGVLNIKGKMHRAHRYAYAQTVGPVPADMQLLHSCDNPPCVNPAHLRPGTARDNKLDSVAKWRTRHRLSRQQVTDILQRFEAGEMQSALAREYGVADSTIMRIVRGISWAA
jgi:hypothetical protein